MRFNGSCHVIRLGNVRLAESSFKATALMSSTPGLPLCPCILREPDMIFNLRKTWQKGQGWGAVRAEQAVETAVPKEMDVVPSAACYLPNY